MDWAPLTTEEPLTPVFVYDQKRGNGIVKNGGNFFVHRKKDRVTEQKKETEALAEALASGLVYV